MRTTLSAAGLAVSVVMPAMAFHKFEEYRISGDEIVAVKTEYHQDEDPMTMRLTLKDSEGRPIELLFESDGDLEPCGQKIEYMIGQKLASLNLRVHLTSDTMNGILVTECAVLYRNAH